MSFKELTNDQLAAEPAPIQSDAPSLGAGLRMIASGLIASGLACVVQALIPFAAKRGPRGTAHGRFVRREPHLGRAEPAPDGLSAPRETRFRLRVGR